MASVSRHQCFCSLAFTIEMHSLMLHVLWAVCGLRLKIVTVVVSIVANIGPERLFFLV